MHSVETALMKVHNDILMEMDKSKGVLLVLLDLSAAFDTIDHSTLLARLESFGITGSALRWHASYLQDRSQKILINGNVSEPIQLKYGVPQGSVVGPKNFTLYTQPLNKIADANGVSVHIYADDTQLYTSFDLNNPLDLIAATSRMENCILELSTWMKINKLKLNDDKTELLVICHPSLKHKIQDISLKIGNADIVPTKSVRNLGAMFDDGMTMTNHITHVCRLMNLHLRSIGRIRKYLDRDSTETIIHALVTSRLDCNNALLAGLPDVQVDRLQRLQNTAVRIATKTPKTESVERYMKAMNWLPVKKRILYKILLYVFKSQHNLAPAYLSNLLKPYIKQRSLRSESQMLLDIPRSRLKTAGDRTFRVIGPKLWNLLPINVKKAKTVNVFKSELKTFLFSLKEDSPMMKI